MPSFKTFADFQKKAQEAQASKLDGEVPQQPQEELRIGLPVRVKGLQARPELNGLEGVLTFFDDQKSRWQVELKNGGGAKLFKAANLEHYISDKDALEILKSVPSKEPVRPPVTPAAPAKAMPSETVPEPAAAQPDAPKSFLERSRYGKAEGPSAAAVAAATAVAKGGKAPGAPLANDDQSDTTLPDEDDEAFVRSIEQCLKECDVMWDDY
ncbi:unnamed protein product [Symbiodinium sp. CCMP2592]|nr:unnamed protein product [Symbiodinium sp. CCMP2592]